MENKCTCNITCQEGCKVNGHNELVKEIIKMLEALKSK